MKRGKIGKFILLLFLVFAGYLVIRLYPVWKAAVYLDKHLDVTCCVYELEVALDREALPEGSDKMLGILAELTGVSEEDMYTLTLKGEVWEDVIHVLVYPWKAQNPLIELYLGDDTDVINETMLYNMIRDTLVEKYALLGPLIPRQQETLYITLEQTERLFGLDLRKLRNFRLKGINDHVGAGGYFLLLAFMSREKGGGQEHYSLSLDQVELRFDISGEGTSPIEVGLQLQNPSELAGKASVITYRMGFPAGDYMTMVKSLAISITQGSEEIVVPGNLVNQNIVELIARIREWVIKLRNGGETELLESL